MEVKNITKNILLAENAALANTFFSRLRGLLGTKRLAQGGGLIIKPCSSIHTFGMAYSIDVIFVDKNNCVLKVAGDIEPGRLAACSGSSYVVELPAGTAARTGTAAGDKISIRAI